MSSLTTTKTQLVESSVVGGSRMNKIVIVKRESSIGQRQTVLLFGFAFFWLLDTFYVTILLPVYGSYFVDLDVSLAKKLTLSVLAALPALWLPLRIDRPSKFALWGFYFVMYVPVSAVFPYMLNEPFPKIVAWICAYACCMATLQFLCSSPPFKIPRAHLAGPAYWSILLFLLSAAVIAIGLQVGFRWEFTAFSDVYELRDMASTQHNRLSSYLYGLLANGLNTVVVIRAIQSRNIFWIAVSFGSSVFAYSIEGGKHSLFLPILAFVAYVLLSRKHRYHSVLIAFFFLASSFIAFIAESLWEGKFNFSLFLLRRVFIIPASVSAKYIEFFSENPFTYMGDGLLRYFVKYPYEVSTPELIANNYFGVGSSANTGYIASSFSQFGFLGIILSTLIVGFLLRTLDSVCKGLETKLGAAFSSVMILVLSNTQVTVGLLTHGVGLMLILAYAYPRERRPASDISQLS